MTQVGERAAPTAGGRVAGGGISAAWLIRLGALAIMAAFFLPAFQVCDTTYSHAGYLVEHRASGTLLLGVLASGLVPAVLVLALQLPTRVARSTIAVALGRIALALMALAAVVYWTIAVAEGGSPHLAWIVPEVGFVVLLGFILSARDDGRTLRRAVCAPEPWIAIIAIHVAAWYLMIGELKIHSGQVAASWGATLLLLGAYGEFTRGRSVSPEAIRGGGVSPAAT